MDNTAIVRIAEATGYDVAKVELVKSSIAPGASDDELMLFLGLCQRTGLDPFMRQIYMIERWTGNSRKLVPQTGIDGFRLIADRTERYAPGREPTFTYDEDGRLVSATAYVKKWVKGDWHECAATAHYREYVQTKKDGAPNKMWAEKPHIMLAKCAEALALRRAFPAELSNIYTNDEIAEEQPRPTPAASNGSRPRIVDQSTGELFDTPKLPETIAGNVANIEHRYNSKGVLFLQLSIAGRKVVYQALENAWLALENGDSVQATGWLRTNDTLGEFFQANEICLQDQTKEETLAALQAREDVGNAEDVPADL